MVTIHFLVVTSRGMRMVVTHFLVVTSGGEMFPFLEANRRKDCWVETEEDEVSFKSAKAHRQSGPAPLCCRTPPCCHSFGLWSTSGSYVFIT